ncbi:hypothetical protein M422DRAFT_269407 [Sphaerobolus stellatus SS14]|uniref:Uncharacterized protein n=1 Tax=Sphaerobolus stellatus (strain SS14) TaxID=990650 RepID=A0A0C9U4M0_SPHS4|nr:hypothetical protein M422DRAFT_269407 [Sphaerobolus stellatus SS14]
MATLYLFLVGRHFLSPQLELFPAQGYPQPDPQNPVFLQSLEAFFNDPLLRIGQTFQFILNDRSRTFAGMYKIHAYLTFITLFMSFVPSLLKDTSPFKGAYTLDHFLNSLGIVAWAWQAATLPSASEGNDVDDPDNE